MTGRWPSALGFRTPTEQEADRDRVDDVVAVGLAVLFCGIDRGGGGGATRSKGPT